MMQTLLEDLRRTSDVHFHPGVPDSLLDGLESDHRIVLPRDHREALRMSNGIEAYGGYVRLFGLGAGACIDAVLWNQADYWKFAWNDRCAGYWCFAETGWGDQYGYALASMRDGSDTEVFFLDALSMAPRKVASSFGKFFEKEFVRSAKAPYDSMMKQARSRLGSLEVESHVVCVPSILLGGTEKIEHVRKMNARAAMICNGDIATQLDEGPRAGASKAHSDRSLAQQGSTQAPPCDRVRGWLSDILPGLSVSPLMRSRS